MNTLIEHIKHVPVINQNYRLTRLDCIHYQQALALFIDVFCKDEPMTQYINMQPHEFKPFAEVVCEQAIIDGFSAAILEKKTNKVVAISLIEDLATPAPLDIPLTPKFDPIFQLLEQLSSDYFSTDTLTKNKIAHLFITAVDKQHRGLGLSTQVNFHGMRLAKARNFSFMISELTNAINERGIIPYLDRFKDCLGEIIYNQFQFDNSKPFANLSGSARAYLWQLPEFT